MKNTEQEQSQNSSSNFWWVLVLLAVIGYFAEECGYTSSYISSSEKKNWDCSCYGESCTGMMKDYYHSRTLYNMTFDEAKSECRDGGFSCVNCSVLSE